MTNTANIRFEPSNVAYVNVDLETHEMTGGVMDETTGIFYPVGGGGENNYCTITIDNSAGEEVLFQEVAIGQNYLENGVLLEDYPSEEIPTGVNVYQTIPIKTEISEGVDLVVCTCATPYAIVSDMVNCSIALENMPYRYISPIDSTKPSSLKITVSTDEEPGDGGGGDIG